MTADELRRRRRRVVVTGCGVISPIGFSAEAFWASLLEGRSGVARITAFPVDDLPTQIAGEIRGFQPERYMPVKASRRLDPYAQYAVAAAVEAVEGAKLSVDEELGPHVGVLVGSGYGASTVQQAARMILHERGPRNVPAHASAAAAVDNASAEIAIRFGGRGPSGSLSAACATGTACVGQALRWIQVGDADVVIAGGADDSVTRLDIAASANARALSRRNDEPERASRPFDRDRDGFVMAAGAGVVVLEEAEHAVGRGAPILAEVVGYAATTDAYHVTAPHPDGAGARRAMRLALGDAGLEPAEVDYVNAHGTSTVLNDRTETQAIRDVFGPHATRIPISSVKSMTGHMIGAAGAVELIATVQALRSGTVPPTINCDDPEDPELNYVAHRPQGWPVRVAMSNSFGFGGHNAVLVVRRWEE